MWLVLLGILLIFIVVLVNWWQDRRVRRSMQARFPEAAHDPLMGSTPARREPGFGQPPVNQASGPLDEVDPGIEAVIDIHFPQPVPGHELAEPLAGRPAGVAKPVRLFAQTPSGDHQQRLRPDETYSSLQMAVLLSNRNGALSDIEWSHLWAWAQSLAERFDGTVEGPEQADVVQQAQALDQLCSELDAQVMLFLKPQEQLTAEQGLEALREAGFLPYGDLLAWMSETGVPRFTVSLNTRPAEPDKPQLADQLVLLLDLPQTGADEQAFSRMASVGRDLAARLKAELLDDQGRPLSGQAFDAIDQQLFQLYQKLDEAGYPAGSARTIRLFS